MKCGPIWKPDSKTLQGQYGAGDFVVKRVGNKSRIIYNPSPACLWRYFIQWKEDILSKLYTDPTLGQGIGIRHSIRYWKVFERYTKKYRLLTRNKAIIPSPALITRPNTTNLFGTIINERIGMDTVKMAYSNYATSFADSQDEYGITITGIPRFWRWLTTFLRKYGYPLIDDGEWTNCWKSGWK